MKQTRRLGTIALLAAVVMALGIGAGIGAVVLLGGQVSLGVLGGLRPQPQVMVSGVVPVSGPAASTASGQGSASVPPAEGNAAHPATALPEEMRAMWVSFLEWRDLVDFSTADTFRQGAAAMFENCRAMGLNTVVAAVRPFGDALYQSRLFPFSHVMQGTQGQDPGYDPLAIMIEEAHARGLRLEAWVNPYRVKHPTNGPNALAANNPATQNPTWVRSVGGEVWYDPGVPEVCQLVVDGVLEIVQNYAVDGIHFDDYFYPEAADESFDADTFAARRETGLDLAAWRRENVNSMMWQVYEAIKAANPAVSFGVSVQGNNDNNFNQMYADVGHWLANQGYADYVMPQLYWGFGHRTQSGRDTYAYANIAAYWAGLPRAAGVRLFAGLGAYRIGRPAADGTRTEAGDQYSETPDEWASGHNLADMVQHTRTVAGFSGFALFRYEYLFFAGDALAAAETAALTQALAASA